MQLHTLKPKTKFRNAQRIGRGGKRGTTSGRGTKGQKARAGAKIRPVLRDILKKLPKLRGRGKHSFKSFASKPAILNIAELETHFSNGDTIDRAALISKGLIRTIGGKAPVVKILGSGHAKKKFTLNGLIISGQARAKIEAAGGSIL